MYNIRFPIVLVDADDTIFDFKKAEYHALKKTLNHFGEDCSDEDVMLYSQINLKHWKKLEKGIIEREYLKIHRFEEWFSLMGFNLDAKLFNAMYAPSLGDFSFLIDGAEKFLKKLSKICDVYIVTNGLTVTQTRRINQSSIKPYIKNIYISETIGYSKPCKEFFDFCINDIGEVDRSKYIILGDSLTSDMQGGRNADIATCYFCRDGKISDNELCDYEIIEYNDFFDIINSSENNNF